MALALLLPGALVAQVPDALDRLVFVPMLIDPATGTARPVPPAPTNFLPGDGNNDYGLVDASRNREQVAASIASYREEIAAIESAGGPYSPDLYESLVDLGSQYQQLGDHETAITLFERAEHISRINNGLFHPEQFASIEGLIESYEATGDIAAANQKRRYLVYLSQQHYGPGDLNVLPSLISLADQNLENFNRTLAAPVMPTISFSSSMGSGPAVARTLTPREMAFGSLFQAQQNYYRAISTMLDNQRYFDPLLLDLEYRLLVTLFLQSHRNAILRDPDYYLSGRNVTATGSLIRNDFNRRSALFGYAEGKNVFERILIYIRNNPQAKVSELYAALMEYGDWSMLYGKPSSAMKKYREAHELLKELQVDPAVIDELFNPAMPAHLPLIAPKPNSPEKFGFDAGEELAYAGHIDIAFTVSRFGRARSFDTLATDGEVTDAIERRLVRYLRNSPFRPRLDENGKAVANRVTVRYYFTYADAAI